MRGARRVSDDTSRSSPPSRRRPRSRPTRRSRSRATARASGPRSMSSRRATGRCSCCGTRDYRTRKSPPRPDWRAARSGRRCRGRAGGWCKPTRRERQVSMSHVDDGTLHAYLDGELSPAEVQGVEAHLAQCPACRGRLDEERALITRAGGGSRVKPRVAEMAAIPRDTALSAATPAPAPAPQPAFVMLDGALVEKASPITVDSARALLEADPLAVPGAPIRAIHSARQIGYSAVVIVEQ